MWIGCLLIITVFWSVLLRGWFQLWVCLEAAIIFSSPLLLSHKSATSRERIIKYYLIQTIRGLLILVSFVAPLNTSIIILGALSLKLGLAPLFMWVPSIFSGQSYFSIFIISTFIKLPGFIILSHFWFKELWIVGVLRVVLGAIGGVVISRIKKLIAYSSINHSGWICLLGINNEGWGLYWVLYRVLTTIVLYSLHLINIKSTVQAFNYSKRRAYGLRVLFLSLAGFPPFLGFGLKLLVLSYLSIIRPGVVLILIITMGASLFYYIILFIYSWVQLNKRITLTNTTKLIVFCVSINLLGLCILY